MSEIAQRKVQQEKGPELILQFMGLTFLALVLIFVIIAFLSSNPINRITMSPILYYLTLAGIFLGMSSYLKEHNYDMRHFKNWKISLILIGILAGVVVGTIIWQ